MEMKDVMGIHSSVPVNGQLRKFLDTGSIDYLIPGYRGLQK
jgi:hypothetical protein